MENIDIKQALSKLGDSEKLFNILIVGFLIKHAKIDNDILVLEKKGDFVEAARLAHSIKGLSMNMCADCLYEKARALEEEYLSRAQKSKKSYKEDGRAFKELQEALRGVEKDVKEYVIKKRILHYEKQQYPESTMSEEEAVDELIESLYGLHIDRLRGAIYYFQELELEGEADKLYRKIVQNIKELDFYRTINMLEKLKELLKQTNE